MRFGIRTLLATLVAFIFVMRPIYAVADEHDEVIPEFSVHASPDERGIDITAELLSKAKALSSGGVLCFRMLRVVAWLIG